MLAHKTFYMTQIVAMALLTIFFSAPSTHKKGRFLPDLSLIIPLPGALSMTRNDRLLQLNDFTQLNINRQKIKNLKNLDLRSLNDDLFYFGQEKQGH